MIDFTNLTTLEIPEGIVVKVARGNEILWEAPSKLFTVTYNFTNGVVSSNLNVEVIERSSYSTTLSLTDDSYVWNTVTVIMNGQVTSYGTPDTSDDIVINITNVTGNISINASYKIISYTNLIPTAVDDSGNNIYYNVGYTDGRRWSSSGKADVEGSNARISGWIPYKAGVWRFKNFNMVSGYCNMAYVVLKKTDGTFFTYNVGNTTNTFNIDTTNDLCTFTMNEDPTIAYLRISGYKGTNIPIVTINEEITEPQIM
jgi:hypothetical protein